ncbi:hypothetical protein GQ44DRAFT_707593 [Phaeosphaeriaceae sp. PMI808]|nr:hypothetical protein GQ44DRAFT_707593 [Phaeosphaeriaceae sp. PMI808]
MTGAIVIIAYPRKDGATFNKEYYISTHIPLASKIWKKHGLKSYTAIEVPEGTYSYSVIMEFETHEGWGAALADPDTKEKIMADLKNFSTEPPVLVSGGIIDQGQV